MSFFLLLANQGLGQQAISGTGSKLLPEIFSNTLYSDPTNQLFPSTQVANKA